MTQATSPRGKASIQPVALGTHLPYGMTHPTLFVVSESARYYFVISNVLIVEVVQGNITVVVGRNVHVRMFSDPSCSKAVFENTMLYNIGLCEKVDYNEAQYFMKAVRSSCDKMSWGVYQDDACTSDSLLMWTDETCGNKCHEKVQNGRSNYYTVGCDADIQFGGDFTYHPILYFIFFQQLVEGD